MLRCGAHCCKTICIQRISRLSPLCLILPSLPPCFTCSASPHVSAFGNLPGPPFFFAECLGAVAGQTLVLTSPSDSAIPFLVRFLVRRRRCAPTAQGDRKERWSWECAIVWAPFMRAEANCKQMYECYRRQKAVRSMTHRGTQTAWF